LKSQVSVQRADANLGHRATNTVHQDNERGEKYPEIYGDWNCDRTSDGRAAILVSGNISVVEFVGTIGLVVGRILGIVHRNDP
jgi:hypothetical protein